MVKQSRKFNGKWYSWVRSRKTKAEAKKYANWSRRNGWNSRIIKGKDHRGKTIYRIYESDARRKGYRGIKGW